MLQDQGKSRTNIITKIGCLFCTSGVSDQMRQQTAAKFAVTLVSWPCSRFRFCHVLPFLSYPQHFILRSRSLSNIHDWNSSHEHTYIVFLCFAQILSSGVNPKSSKLFRRTCQNNKTQCHRAPNCAFTINRRTMLDFDYSMRNCSRN